MKKWIGTLLLIASVSSAATIEDVRILDIKQGPENVELKLQSKTAPHDSFFFVDILKEDPGSFEKLSHVINKLARKSNYRLDLEIPSFSASPSGSYYRGERVFFIGSAEREPNAVKSPPKTKKAK